MHHTQAMKHVFNLLTTGILLICFLTGTATPGEKRIIIQEDLAKVWPLIEIVRIEYYATLTHLECCKSEQEKEEYLREYESLVKQKYLKKVLDLNLRQGKLLLLLIHRELGQTPFDLLKMYLSYRKARFWQQLARIAGADLKAEYSAKMYPEIEQTIKKAGIEITTPAFGNH